MRAAVPATPRRAAGATDSRPSSGRPCAGRVLDHPYLVHTLVGLDRINHMSAVRRNLDRSFTERVTGLGDEPQRGTRAERGGPKLILLAVIRAGDNPEQHVPAIRTPSQAVLADEERRAAGEHLARIGSGGDHDEP